MYNVLLVEDDIQIREVIGDFFARRDEIRLDLAADGEIGLSKILNGQYDLIVLDIMMPGIDGFELCRIIRKRSDVPVVFLTGKVREEDVLYGYELGADDYIVKPFSIKVLYSKLLAILEARYQENKNNPKTSGLASRLEAMQKQAEELKRQRMNNRMK
jgi:DNA-binding response OmpR family regulator